MVLFTTFTLHMCNVNVVVWPPWPPPGYAPVLGVDNSVDYTQSFNGGETARMSSYDNPPI